MKKISFLICLLICLSVSAQVAPKLKPGIGQNSMPDDTDSINDDLTFINNDSDPGPGLSEIIPDFKLYNLKGDSLDMDIELSKGKPVFLICGSYTCPQYRQVISFFDSLAACYKNEVSFFTIYTLEAHPYCSANNPYNVQKPAIDAKNLADSILFDQPETYGERKQLAETMIREEDVDIPVFIDGPGNNWLNNFGPLPNMAYLVDTNGIVMHKCLNNKKGRGQIATALRLLVNHDCEN